MNTSVYHPPFVGMTKMQLSSALAQAQEAYTLPQPEKGGMQQQPLQQHPEALESINITFKLTKDNLTTMSFQ